MVRWSAIDRRAKRYAPKQCVADYGMHRDAPSRYAGSQDRVAAWWGEPLRDELAKISRLLHDRGVGDDDQDFC